MILNLTQHPATADQIAVGVVDLPAAERASLIGALTFGALPSAQDVIERAERIAELACYNGLAADDEDSSPAIGRAMIGGALWLMAPLADALLLRAIEPMFAFSVRETVEQTLPDGSVRKTAVFRHSGFVPALTPLHGIRPGQDIR